MLMINGIDSSVFVRDARNAVRLPFAISSALASTMPSIFFWFGQINTHTLKSIISAQPGANADCQGVSVARVRQLAQRKGIIEHAAMQ